MAHVLSDLSCDRLQGCCGPRVLVGLGLGHRAHNPKPQQALCEGLVHRAWYRAGRSGLCQFACIQQLVRLPGCGVCGDEGHVLLGGRCGGVVGHMLLFRGLWLAQMLLLHQALPSKLSRSSSAPHGRLLTI
jgi:hypothetical protein